MTDHEDDEGAVCPVFLLGQRRDAFHTWSWAQRGFLPHEGGWAQQDAALIEQLDIIEDAIARVRREQADAAAQQKDAPR